MDQSRIHPFWRARCASLAALLFALTIGLATTSAALAHGDDAPAMKADAGSAQPGMPEAHEHAVPHENGELSVSDHHDQAGAEPHDHADHGWAKTPFERTLSWIGKFHPAATHFPVGLLIAAALAELLFIRTHNASFRQAARFCLWVGALGAAGTVVLGWFYAGFSVADKEWFATAHRWNGTTVGVLSLVSLWLGEKSHRAGPGNATSYRTLLFVTAALAGLNGYLGGVMVYGFDHYAWPHT